MSTTLKLKNICKLADASNSTYVLKQIDMQVNPQEFIGIISDDTRSTSALFNTLGLLDHPTTGAYTINGKPTGALNDSQITQLREQTFDFLFRALFLNERQSAQRNIILPLTKKGMSTPQAKEVALEQLQFLGNEDLLKEMVYELTAAQKQRVALARALATNNDVLLAEEPFQALEEQQQKELLQCFKQIHNERQKTLIILTQNSELIAPECHRLFRLTDNTLKPY